MGRKWRNRMNEMALRLKRGEWRRLNRERGDLIDRQIAGTLPPELEPRLAELQAIADTHLAATKEDLACRYCGAQTGSAFYVCNSCWAVVAGADSQ